MTRMPVLFLSHGAPSLVLEENETTRFLNSLSRRMPRPKAILMVTAHWETSRIQVSAAEQPGMIYDFAGFPEAMYRMEYRAPGSPVIADEIINLLKTAGFTDAGTNSERGFDHGTWVPLKLIFPNADIPVVQIPVQPHAGASHHHKIGKALRSLRDQGILIIGSGGATHNLREFGRYLPGSTPAEHVVKFDQWLFNSLINDDETALLDYVNQAPDALRNHPTPEHLLPLFVPFGARHENETAQRIFHRIDYGMLSMAAYGWGLQ